MRGFRLSQAKKVAARVSKRLAQCGYFMHMTEEERHKHRVMFRKTRVFCSCWMCGHRRKLEGPPVQELRQIEEEF